MAGTDDTSKARRKYKIRLVSGREVGPLPFEDVLKLIQRRHVAGSESARRHPEGEWLPLREIEEFREHLPEAPLATVLAGVDTVPVSSEAPEDATYVGPAPGAATGDEEDATFVGAPPALAEVKTESRFTAPEAALPAVVPEPMTPAPVAADSTVVFSREDLKREGIQEPEGHLKGIPIGPRGDPERNRRNRRIQILGVAVILIGALALLQPRPTPPPQLKWEPVRPEIPRMTSGAKPDPAKSKEHYSKGMAEYAKDDIASYRKAVDWFSKAVRADSSNTGAVAMLAATYLNLIDVSLKDENYFKTVMTLLDLARSAKLDLLEVLVAEVEYFIAIRKPDAAAALIDDYSKVREKWPYQLFLIVAQTWFERGELQQASRYLANIPENVLFTPRVSYLRGQVAERAGDPDAAVLEYQRALEISSDHAKSRLRLADLLAKKKDFASAAPHLVKLIAKPQLLLPPEMARALFLDSLVKDYEGKAEASLAQLQKAVKVDPENRVYKVEYYARRARMGKGSPQLAREYKMYELLISAERLIKENKHQEALVTLIAARGENPSSIEPLVELGDLFIYLNDVANARLNYEEAAKRAPKDIKVWSKYINSLIQSYEWPEAEKAMAIFRRNPEAGSTVDKAAGDLYARMGKYEEALAFYLKAMGRETIDPGVYLAMADLLMKVGKHKEAPLFYAMALRVDPLNVEAEIGIARAAAEEKGIDSAIQLLKNKLAQSSRASAPYEAALAELMIRRKEWELAKMYINQAKSRDPEYAYPWKLLGQLYQSLDGIEKGAIDKALEAYQSYSNRNPSDPSGYIDAFFILGKRGKFEKAEEMLNKVVVFYPKYPQYHQLRGWLKSLQGNYRVAVEEFEAELQNNPGSIPALLSLGDALIELRDFKSASAKFSEAMQLDPTNAKAKQLAGYAAYLMGNHQAAIALFQASIALYLAGPPPDASYPMVYKRLGDAYRAVRSIKEMRDAYLKYLEMEPDAPDAAELRRY